MKGFLLERHRGRVAPNLRGGLTHSPFSSSSSVYKRWRVEDGRGERRMPVLFPSSLAWHSMYRPPRIPDLFSAASRMSSRFLSFSSVSPSASSHQRQHASSSSLASFSFPSTNEKEANVREDTSDGVQNERRKVPMHHGAAACIEWWMAQHGPSTPFSKRAEMGPWGLATPTARKEAPPVVVVPWRWPSGPAPSCSFCGASSRVSGRRAAAISRESRMCDGMPSHRCYAAPPHSPSPSSDASTTATTQKENHPPQKNEGTPPLHSAHPASPPQPTVWESYLWYSLFRWAVRVAQAFLILCGLLLTAYYVLCVAVVLAAKPWLSRLFSCSSSSSSSSLSLSSFPVPMQNLEEWEVVEPTLREGDVVLMGGTSVVSTLITAGQLALSKFGYFLSPFLYSHVAVVVAPARWVLEEEVEEWTHPHRPHDTNGPKEGKTTTPKNGIVAPTKNKKEEKEAWKDAPRQERDGGGGGWPRRLWGGVPPRSGGQMEGGRHRSEEEDLTKRKAGVGDQNDGAHHLPPPNRVDATPPLPPPSRRTTILPTREMVKAEAEEESIAIMKERNTMAEEWQEWRREIQEGHERRSTPNEKITRKKILATATVSPLSPFTPPPFPSFLSFLSPTECSSSSSSSSSSSPFTMVTISSWTRQTPTEEREGGGKRPRRKKRKQHAILDPDHTPACATTTTTPIDVVSDATECGVTQHTFHWRREGAVLMEAMVNSDSCVADIHGDVRTNCVQCVYATDRLWSRFRKNNKPAYARFAVRRLLRPEMYQEPAVSYDAAPSPSPLESPPPPPLVSSLPASCPPEDPLLSLSPSPSPPSHLPLHPIGLGGSRPRHASAPLLTFEEKVRAFAAENEGRPLDCSLLYFFAYVSPSFHYLLRPQRLANGVVSCSELITELYQYTGVVQRKWKWMPLSAAEEHLLRHRLSTSSSSSSSFSSSSLPDYMPMASLLSPLSMDDWISVPDGLLEGYRRKEKKEVLKLRIMERREPTPSPSHTFPRTETCHGEKAEEGKRRTTTRVGGMGEEGTPPPLPHAPSFSSFPPPSRMPSTSFLFSGPTKSGASQWRVLDFKYCWWNPLPPSPTTTTCRRLVTVEGSTSPPPPRPVPMMGHKEVEEAPPPLPPSSRRSLLPLTAQSPPEAERRRGTLLFPPSWPTLDGRFTHLFPPVLPYSTAERGEVLRDLLVRGKSQCATTTAFTTTPLWFPSLLQEETVPSSTTRPPPPPPLPLITPTTPTRIENAIVRHHDETPQTEWKGKERKDGGGVAGAETLPLRAGDVARGRDGRWYQLRWRYGHSSLCTCPFQFTDPADRTVLDYAPGYRLGPEIRMRVSHDES